MTKRGRRIAVVGGGLAGITAALRCADAGHDVVLLESRGLLGGLTHSFTRGDLHVDNGQHVFLRCCTAYLGLLRRLGVADRVHLQPRLEIPVRSPRSRRPVWLRRNRLPAPLHLADSVLRYSPLGLADRMRFAGAALALKSVDPAAPGSDRRTFGEWLRAHGQSREAITKLWDLVGIATLNAPAERASLGLAATVFQVGLLTDAAAADIGWATVPLRRLHGDPALAALTAAGVDVRLGSKVTALGREDDRWRVGADEPVEADSVVLAVPPGAAAKLLPAGAVRLPPNFADGLGSSPIVNVHVVFDRPVAREPFFAAIDSPVQWVFDRTASAGLTGGGQYLAISLSAADEEIGLPVRALRQRMLPALLDLLPGARDAGIRDFFVTRERHATFRPAPGCAGLRPPARTRVPGLVLAGAWTATGWPATMEGAVRSGEAAAQALPGTPARVPGRPEGIPA